MTLERTVDVAVEDKPRDDVANEAAPDAEAVAESWDAELYALVSTNAELMVRCSWTDDPVTLGDAMLTYPRTMTAADGPFLISIVKEMLADRVIQTEDEPEKKEGQVEDESVAAEPEDKKRTQEKTAAPTEESHRKTQTETHTPQIKPKIANPSQSPAKTTATSQELKMSITSEEKPNEPTNETAAAVVAAVAGSTKDRPAQPTQHSAASEPAVRLSERPVDTLDLHKTARVSEPTRRNEQAILFDGGVALATPRAEKLVDRLSGESEDAGILGKPSITNTNSPAAPKALSVPNSTLEPLGERLVIDEVKITTVRQSEVSKITGTEVTAPSVIEEYPALVGPQPVKDQKSELPAWVSALGESESTAPIDGIFAVGEDQLTVATPDYQMETSGLIDFNEEEVLINHFQEVDIRIRGTIEHTADMEKAPASQRSGEPNPTEQEVVSLEQQVQANVMAEEIESSLIQLAERIKINDPQITETANENLDKIIATVAKIEIPGRNIMVTGAKAQEELEELFTELFDMVSIDYTPELINYLAHQTLIWHLVDEIEKDGEEAEEVPQASGTHVIIKRLIAALKTIKRVTGHVCAIGRAALVLCSFSFQLKPDESF